MTQILAAAFALVGWLAASAAFAGWLFLRWLRSVDNDNDLGVLQQPTPQPDPDWAQQLLAEIESLPTSGNEAAK